MADRLLLDAYLQVGREKSTLTQPLTDLAPPSFPAWGLGTWGILVMGSALAGGGGGGLRIRLCNESDSGVLNAYRLVPFHMQDL